MNKKINILIIIIVIFLTGFVFDRINTNKSNVYEEQNISSIKKNKKLLSMNLEQTAGAGDYKTVAQSGWPTEGYKFNTKLSRCENGNELSWDDENKKVLMSGNNSDKCYVYFDKIITLAEYVISQYTGTQGDNGIYYHDSSLTNGAGDNSYRYAGVNSNNFVCFGSDEATCPTDNLYRIIGVFGDNYHGVTGKQLVKLIKYDYATSALLGTDGDYYDTYANWGAVYAGDSTDNLDLIGVYYWNNTTQTNTWSESLLNKINLNTNFINNIGSPWANKIATITWKVGGNIKENINYGTPATAYTNEITNPAESTTYSAKVGLMYVSDYGFAASPSAWTTTLNNYDGYDDNNVAIKDTNWMYSGLYEWPITRASSSSSLVYYIHRIGFVTYMTLISSDGPSKFGVDYVGAIRPTFFLTSDINYVSGSGSMSDPIILGN